MKIKQFLFIMMMTCNQLSLAANLITNGSFEDGDFQSNVIDTIGISRLNVGNANLFGWSVINNTIDWINSPTYFNGWLLASNGNRLLDLTSYYDYPPFGGISQQIDTIVGKEYALYFDLGSSSAWNPIGFLNVVAGNKSLKFQNTSNTSLNNWETFNVSFVATDTKTNILFTGEGLGPIQHIGLDNISVSQVPEPSSLFLLFSGFIGFFVTRKKFS